MSQEMTQATKHKWAPNPFLFQSEKGFDSIRPREILLWLGTHYVFVNGVFWLCLQEYPPASQAPTYPFPWGSTNERGHKPNPYDTNILPNSKLQWILLNRIFSSATVITGLTYIAFKWLWVVVLQWISHDVQFCSKGKMGSSLRFYEQFLTLAPSMNKNLCSFCSCSLLNGVSVDFQQGFRGLDSSQLAFVSTHKQLCSFPAFDTFTPDHFASNFCGLIFRISNWQLTISSWLLAENILSSEWYSLLLENLKRKAGENMIVGSLIHFSPCLDDLSHFFYHRLHGSCATRAFATGALNLSGFSPRKNVQQQTKQIQRESLID